MNSFNETLNHWGGYFSGYALTMFWQSSLLIVVLFAFDLLFRRKLRASIRYALWLVILVKLCLPPTLALPTSPAWWLHKIPPPLAATHYTVTYDNEPLPEIPQTPLPVFVPPKPAMTFAACLLMFSASISAALLLWLLMRWWQITQQVRRAATSARLSDIGEEAQKIVGMKSNVQVKLTANSMSPAVCGLFRPAILIPQSLADNFSDEQLRAVLLHELIHLRRRDVWLNFLQALLQIFYWWHPLVWLANARIRRVREEAVDDDVMLALRDESESYAPTLLEVAKLALNRPLASLGLVGILESRHALRQRIERLVDFRPPRRAGLTLVSLVGILAFTAVAVPMGQAPVSVSAATDAQTLPQSAVTRNFIIYPPTDEQNLEKLFEAAGVKMPPTVFFYLDNRILLAQGTMQQLALIEQVVSKLNGFSPKKNNVNHFAKQTAATTGANQAATNLLSRTFKVDKYIFTRVLRSISGLQTNSVSTMAESLFNKLGVGFQSPGKSIFFNDRLGMLFVKATEPDLDTVENAIEALNQVAPQLHIKARFVEVPMNGFVDPAMLTNNPGGGMTGIINPENLKTFLKLLQTKSGVETLAEPEVTTISGRHTQMRTTQVFTVVTNFAYLKTATNSSIVPQTDQVETGAILDVVPVVLSDGYTIDLRTTASDIEFSGYDEPPVEHIPKGDTSVHVPIVLPSFRVRQASAHLNLYDNQTLVFEKLHSEVTVGGKEVDAKQNVEDKELLVFITVTLVDPAGNRIHSDEEMPFAKDGVPVQPPQ
jgi:beta-lactamase regulating signal transducer with metallopeptidase domain